MIDFLRCFKLTTCQLSPTAVRTICEIEKLDQIHGTSLGIDELKYWYSLRWQTYGFSLKVSNDAPNLVLALPDSHNGADEDTVILIRDIVPNRLYKPIPREASESGCLLWIILNFCFPSLGLFFEYRCILLFTGNSKVFDQPPLYFIKDDYINALGCHADGSVLIGQADHPRADHNLLGYTNTSLHSPKEEKIKVKMTRLWFGAPGLVSNTPSSTRTPFLWCIRSLTTGIISKMEYELHNGKKVRPPYLKKAPVEKHDLYIRL